MHRSRWGPAECSAARSLREASGASRPRRHPPPCARGARAAARQSQDAVPFLDERARDERADVRVGRAETERLDARFERGLHLERGREAIRRIELHCASQIAASSASASGRASLARDCKPVVRLCKIAASFSPYVSRRPTSASHSMTPTENTSARRSTCPPAICSGATYASLPLNTPARRLRRRVGRLRDAEVDELHLAVVRDDDVVRADVAVHDVERLAVEVAQFVCIVQPREHVARACAGAIAQRAPACDRAARGARSSAGPRGTPSP